MRYDKAGIINGATASRYSKPLPPVPVAVSEQDPMRLRSTKNVVRRPVGAASYRSPPRNTKIRTEDGIPGWGLADDPHSLAFTYPHDYLDQICILQSPSSFHNFRLSSSPTWSTTVSKRKPESHRQALPETFVAQVKKSREMLDKQLRRRERCLSRKHDQWRKDNTCSYCPRAIELVCSTRPENNA